ncbi:hypothetical protein GE21DRAFT_1883 [Neurospora crassa]|uniref:DUF7730 domain-containing protein n=1 Tax=Neurospora crassa (strain ATCC 24698 / 74-OR23-1A / CBS 708.71 / DSM 1257 / FGSC 987) TaxID=367110 RepID=Q7SEA7_NEUCR|nr:hypothetical protein NCU00827 [Neurospora crassa OR74A]EAA35134.2 hypothetical protein NCU00827 [Neurospora crassa OR74A]KHE79840.1 hypothetical protein GE21DRAFT_1883 [Neurospora crassa]|eukprot:XP_964370.2 hypothetical protein NCU00827 [Neurospora crassa OR74A]
MIFTSTMSNNNNNNNKPPNLFRLPGEIRNQIYESLLVFPEPIIIHTSTDEERNDQRDGDKSKSGAVVRVHLDNADERKRWPLSSRLLTVFLICKQIHSEASAVFYSHNQFRAPPALCRFPSAQLQSNYVMRGFIDRIGTRNLTSLRHLCIPFPLDSGAGQRYLDWPTRRSFEGLLGLSPAKLDALVFRANVVPGALPSLWRRCPNVEVVEFDLSWSGPGHSFWKVRPHDREILLGSMDTALREEFTRLREIVVNIQYDGPIREISESCEALMEEMRGYGWKVEVRDCSGDKDERLRIPYWYHPSPSSHGFRWTGGWEEYSAAFASTGSRDDDDADDDAEHVKPTAERKRQFAKDIGRKIVHSRAFGWSAVVIFSPTIPVLMAIDSINKRRRKRKIEKLSSGQSTASVSHHGSVREFR